MKLVLVDIDGTLVRGPSSERRFARYLREQRRIGAREATSFAWFALRYLPIYGSGVLRKNKAYLAGIPEAEARDLAEEFVNASLVHSLFEPACAKVRYHLQHGDEVWLLSGTLNFIAMSVARLLRLEHVIASECQLGNGKILARPPLTHPYGKAKLQIARQLCEEKSIAWDQVVAYADSWADRHLLEKVGQPIAVLPDKKLAALAAKRGWETIDDEIVLATGRRGIGTE